MLKRLGKDESLCIRCHSCEEACAGLYFKKTDPAQSAVSISSEMEKPVKITVCSQCGICADICPVQAITGDSRGVYRIDKKICVGCFACVGFCPEAAMFHHDECLEPFKCVACGACVKVCPTGALFMVDQQKGDQP
jgi:Fe-S-cluster-containing hydrogenase component 2